MLTLFGNLESGNVHKVQMLLHRLSVTYQRVDVAQPRGEPSHAAFRKINPIGKVPAVLFKDGDVLTESGAILFYFAQGTDLWPENSFAQAEALRWMFFEQYSHEPALAVMRYLNQFAGDPRQHQSRLAELRPRSLHALSTMEGQLAKRNFIAGDHMTIADVALYPYTAWSEEADIGLDGFPAVQEWVGRIEQSPRFLPLMTDGAAETLSFQRYFDL